MLKRALFWTLLPLVAIQGLRLRRHATGSAAPAGPAAGVVHGRLDRPALHLLALGDSIVAGVGAGRSDNALAGATARALAQLTGRTVHWFGQGRIGAGVDEVRRQLLPTVPAQSYDCVVVSAGVNDITSLRRSRPWARHLSALLDDLRARDPHAIVVMTGMPPLHGFPVLPMPLRNLFGMRARSFSQAARLVLAGRPGMLFVPLDFDPQPGSFSDDGFHPGPEGYAALGQVLAQALAACPSLGQVDRPD